MCNRCLRASGSPRASTGRRKTGRTLVEGDHAGDLAALQLGQLSLGVLDDCLQRRLLGCLRAALACLRGHRVQQGIHLHSSMTRPSRPGHISQQSMDMHMHSLTDADIHAHGQRSSTSLVLSLAALTVAAAAAAAAELAAALAAVEAALAQLASRCRPSLKRCLRSSACDAITSQSPLDMSLVDAAHMAEAMGAQGKDPTCEGCDPGQAALGALTYPGSQAGRALWLQASWSWLSWR